MLIGALSAGLMLITFLLEETLFSVLPLPWRLIPVSLIVALALMHRVSFEVGAVFFLASVLASVMTGLAPVGVLFIGVLTVVIIYGLISRIFARRSLAAFTGMSLVTSYFYLILRFGLISPVPHLFPWMIVFLGLAAALLAAIMSLALEWFASGFNKRFVSKDDTYEIQSIR